MLPTGNFSWTKKGNYVHCFKGKGGQQVFGLWEAEELTDFHDADLAKATTAVNAIVKRIEKNNKDPERKLSLIEIQGRHLLVWATYGSVSPYDDEDTIIKALKLKRSSKARR